MQDLWSIFFLYLFNVRGDQHQNIEELIKKIAFERGHKIERILLNPTID